MSNETVNQTRSLWAGRRFQCNDTGQVLEIPDGVNPKEFFSFGNCFVDVGDGYYSRFGGNITELSKFPFIVNVELREEDARFLKALVQNPLYGDEDESMFQFRYNVFHAIKESLDET